MLGYLAICFCVIMFVLSIYAQSALSGLLDYFRDRPQLLEKTGNISDLYFLFEFTRCRYGFVHYLLTHPEPPGDIGAAFPDYARLRKISNFVYCAHLAFGVYLCAVVFYTLVLRRL